jgi:acyl carrier protein
MEFKMADLKAKVTDIIIKKLGVEESQITDDANFTKDLGADSLDTVELIMEFEKEFDLTIEDSDAEKIQTVGDVVKFMTEKGVS